VPISCSGVGYYQYDFVGYRSYSYIISPSGWGPVYSLRLYENGVRYQWDSKKCTKSTISKDQMPTPQFLDSPDAIYLSKSGDVLTYLLVQAWPEFWFDLQDKHYWDIRINSANNTGIPFAYRYLAPVSLENKDHVTNYFTQVLTGPGALVSRYWEVPSICKNQNLPEIVAEI